MARIFITGSADGLGQLAAIKLIEMGHQVVLHARNAQRSAYAMSKVPGAEKVLIADLSDMDETKRLAEEVNALGTVNTLAPYILTCLIRLEYACSMTAIQRLPVPFKE